MLGQGAGLADNSIAGLPGSGPPIAGMAWYGAWEPPYFPVKTKVEEQSTNFAVFTPGTLPATVSGMAWYGEWEPPYFPTKTKPEQIPTNFVALTPKTLPAGIAGMAWQKSWEPPYFPTRVKTELMPTEFSLFYFQLFPPPTQAAWYFTNWEPPYFPVRVKTELMPIEFVSLTPSTLPVGIAGVAWYGQWEPPYFPTKYKTQLNQFESRALNLVPVAQTPKTYFFGGWEPAPRPSASFKVILQQTTMWSNSAAFLPPLAILVGLRQPLYTGSEPSLPGSGNYPPNCWLGQTSVTVLTDNEGDGLTDDSGDEALTE